jgi:hypothetical protein
MRLRTRQQFAGLNEAVTISFWISLLEPLRIFTIRKREIVRIYQCFLAAGKS